MIKNKKLTVTLVIYCILFYGVWTLTELVLKDPVFALSGKNDTVFALLRDGVWKNLVWTLPALLLIRHFSGDMLVGFRDMWRFKKKDIIILSALMALCAAYVICSLLFSRHGLAISPSFGWDDIIVVLFVGLAEELVFRGWLLNSMEKHADTEAKKYLVLLLNAVMFLLIHFPIWISSGELVSNMTHLGFLPIMVLSALFGMSFLKTGNILVPVIVHSFYDLLVFMLA